MTDRERFEEFFSERMNHSWTPYPAAWLAWQHRTGAVERLRAEVERLKDQGRTACDLFDECRALQVKVEALRRDAERWAYWRKHHHYCAMQEFGYSFAQIEHWSNEQNETKLDAAIDAAMSGKGE